MVNLLVNFDVTTDLTISLCQTENAASHWLLEIHNKMAAPFEIQILRLSTIKLFANLSVLYKTLSVLHKIYKTRYFM